MKIEDVDEKFLHEWHDQMFETSKAILLEAGHLEPYVWMLTSPGRVADDLRSQVMPMEPVAKSGKAELAIVCLPLDYGNKTLSGILYDFVLKPEARARYEFAYELAQSVPGFTDDRFHQTMVQTYLKAAQWSEADLIAAQIKAMLKLSGAVAYVKQDDAWCLQLKDGEEKLPNVQPRNDPRSAECILSEMEWFGGMRVINQPYFRNGLARGEGRVKSFGEPRTLVMPRVSADASGGSYEGRFCWMLPGLDATSPAPAECV